MIPNIAEKINEYLKKNNLVALFPFVPNKKTVFRKDFVISWTHNYTTLVTRDNKEYFLKVSLEPEKFDDLTRQVHFYQLLEQQKHLTFKTPQLYEWNTSDNFYFYLREKMNGILLGNCVRAKSEFATRHIFSQLQKGFEEINELPMTICHPRPDRGSDPKTDPRFHEDDNSFRENDNVKSNDTHWQKTKDIDWLKHKIQRTDENETITNILGPDLWQQIKNKLTSYILNLESNPPAGGLESKPLWGDPGPNNFLVEHGTLSIIDYAPFSYGYKYADFAEFASFCIFSDQWKQFIKITIDSRSEINGNDIFNYFFIIFLIDRIASVLWLESKGQLKTQLKKPKEFYIETVKKEIAIMLSV